MSVLLIVVGAIVLVAGIGTIGFGIPINEFSFGNTLIESGTMAAIGGLVLIGLGAVVTQLQRVADGLAMWTPSHPGARTPESVEPAAAAVRPTAARPPFPRRPAAKPYAEPAPVTAFDHAPQPEPDTARAISPPAEPPPAPPPAEQPLVAPSLHNPDIPPIETGDEVSLSPVQPQTAPAPEPAKVEKSDPQRAAPRSPFGLHSLRPSRPPPAPPSEGPTPATTHLPPPSEFDEMWPASEPKSDQVALGEDGKVEPTLEHLPPLPQEQEPEEIAEPHANNPSEPPRAVAILKSGVVDGMGYTLYVDGSIEAELPQGTLRFSSINDLRHYLEKNA